MLLTGLLLLTGLIAPHGLLGLLSYVSQDHQPRKVLLTIGWVIPHQLFIKKTFYRVTYSQIFWGLFLMEIWFSQMAIAV